MPIQQHDQPPPERPGPEPSVVTRAVVALTAFSDDLDRETAAMLIRMWKHFRDLNPVQLEEVLRHFAHGEPDPLERPLPGGGWMSGSSTGGGL